MSIQKRRVVVTGLGIVSPLGLGIKENWDALSHGRSGIDKITHFDASEMASQMGGEVRGFDVTKYISRKESRRLDLYTHYGIAAAQMAVDDAGLEITPENAERTGVMIGSGIGGLQSVALGEDTVRKKGPRRLTPYFVLQAICNTLSGSVSIRFGIKGPNSCVVTACSTGVHSIGDAFRHIQYGTADTMLAGGADAVVCELGVASFSAMKALSTRNDEPQKASRPFDKDRDGFVIAEGSGVVVLEELEQAKKRGAKIYVEVIGYGLNGDAFHLTAPSPEGEGAARCMNLTLKDAGISPEDVDHINTHGTSTDQGDVAETMAIKTVFREHAPNIAINSTKSMTGHLLGAAGGVESIFAILAMQHQLVPPTINLDNPDPRCDLDYTPHQAKETKVDVALTNSFGFGGTNGGLLFRRFN